LIGPGIFANDPELNDSRQLGGRVTFEISDALRGLARLLDIGVGTRMDRQYLYELL
jgi:hypothetical protein